MTEAVLGSQEDKEKSIDVARSVIVSCLPSSLQDESDDGFSESIYEMFEKTFCVTKDAIDHLIRFPRLDPDGKEFGCKCLVSFRSRVHKHRVIAQKSKLDEPTTVTAVTEVPRDLFEPEEEFEMADECGYEDGDETLVEEEEEESANNNSGSLEEPLIVKGNENMLEREREEMVLEVAASRILGPKIPGNEVLVDETEEHDDEEYGIEEQDDIDEKAVTEAVTSAVASVEGMNKDGFADDILIVGDENLSMADLFETEGQARSHMVKPASDEVKATNAMHVKPAASESAAKTHLAGGNEKAAAGHGADADEETGRELEIKNDTLEKVTHDDGLPLLAKIDKHKEHFMKLPVKWDGAPEFQWRNVSTKEDRRTLTITNILQSDLRNPWLYPAIGRAIKMTASFPRPFQSDVTGGSPGSVDLTLKDDFALAACAINDLVHIRTPCYRRLKIFLPQTDVLMRYRGELERRLGRVREPPKYMAQLVVKPVDESVTEQAVRNIAFRHWDIESVEFKKDGLNQRCALLTFASAERAIAAHSSNTYVYFGAASGREGWSKVYYAYTAFKNWFAGEGLILTQGEFYTYRKENKAKKVDEDGNVIDHKKPQKPKVGQKRVLPKIAPVKQLPKTPKLYSSHPVPTKVPRLSGANAVPIGRLGAATSGTLSEWRARQFTRVQKWKNPQFSNEGDIANRNSFDGGYALVESRTSQSIKGGWSQRGSQGSRAETTGTEHSSFRGDIAGHRSVERDYGYFAAEPIGQSHRFLSQSSADRSRSAGYGPSLTHQGGQAYPPNSCRDGLGTAYYDPYCSTHESPRSREIESEDIMEGRIREQRKQLAQQEYLIRQQQIIGNLGGQLRGRTGYRNNSPRERGEAHFAAYSSSNAEVGPWENSEIGSYGYKTLWR